MSRTLGIWLTLLFLCSSCTMPVDEYGRFLRNVEAAVRERSAAVASTPEPSDQVESDENPEYFCAVGNTAFRAEYTITDSDGVIRKAALIDYTQERMRMQLSDYDIVVDWVFDNWYINSGTSWDDANDLLRNEQFYWSVLNDVVFHFLGLDPYFSSDLPWPNLIVERTLVGKDQLDGTLANVYEYAKFIPSLSEDRSDLNDVTRVWVDPETNQCLKAESIFRGELFRAVYSYPVDLSVPDPMAEP